MNLARVSICSVALFAAASSGAAQLEVRWNELAPLVVGRTVTIVLPDGTVSGEAAAVREDALAIDVRKTSSSQAHPKGMASIPRSSVTTLQVKESRSSGGRVLGTIVGLIVGMVGGGEIVAHGTHSEGAAVGTFLAVTVASTVGGYYVGKSVDQHAQIIRVVP